MRDLRQRDDTNLMSFGKSLRGDLVSLSNIFLNVGVDFNECDFVGSGELGGELFIDGRHLLTRSTPVGIDFKYCQQSISGWLK